MNINGRVAWVTGGISGIGGGVAEALYKEGAKLLLTDVNEELGQKCVEKYGDSALFVKADNGNWEELKAAAAKAVEKWGRMDFLCNCAGRGYKSVILTDDTDLLDEGIKSFDEGVKALLNGSFYTAVIAANYMRKNDPDENGEKGSIIFISSMAADKNHMPWDESIAPLDHPDGLAYPAAKSGLEGLKRNLARVFSYQGIRVNTIKPGYIITPLHGEISADGKHTKTDVWHPKFQLFPKLGGQPENIATMAMEIFRNPFVNAADIAVDAGIIG